MLILKAQGIKKQFADRPIFAFDDLSVFVGDKIGIVGQNGAGKTTLLNILTGEEEADEGTIRRFCEIAYLKQFSKTEEILDEKLVKEMHVQGKTTQRFVSGGENTRLKIAQAFALNRMLLLADEPTANLDADGIELLTKKLIQVESLLLISHDRNLLDRVCNRIIEIEHGKLTEFSGNYSSYVEQKKERTNREWYEYKQYQEEKARLEDSIAERQQKAKAMKKTPSRMGNSEARLHKRKTQEKKKKVQSAANSLQSHMEKLEIKSKPVETSLIQLDFMLTHPPANKIVIEAERFNFGYGDTQLFQNASFGLQNGKKTALIGNNGAGKTSLIKAIYAKEKGIRIVPKAELGYFYQGFENLEEDKTVLENVMRDSVQSQTTARTILARLLIGGDDVHKRVSIMSGGEKNKVSFAKLFVSRANVLLLDEPTNFLDIPSVEVLQVLLSDYEGTVLFVSHDSAFVNAVADRLMVIQEQKIVEFEGNLDAFQKSKKTTDGKSNTALQETRMRMRMTQILTLIPKSPEAKRPELETEYQQLQEELKQFL